MSSVYTNIARKRIEQSQEASQRPSNAAVTEQVDTPTSNAQLSTKADITPIESKKPTKPQNRLPTSNPLLLD